YKGPAYVQLVFEAECGILEADVITGNKLNDHDVHRSLVYLVRRLRGEDPPLPENTPHGFRVEGREGDLIAESIRDRWQHLFDAGDRVYSVEERTGVLRTILGSVELHARPVPDSRGYLDFIARFLGQAGFSLRRVHPGDLPAELRARLPGDAAPE